MSRAHAVLSASSSSRWIACPPSALLQEKYRDYGSVYAEAGSEAHALGESKVLEFLGKPHTDPRPEMKYLEQEMEDATDAYVSFIAEQIATAKETCPDPLVLVEQEVDYSRWAEGGFGTADAIIVGEGHLWITDLKYGTGIEIDAQSNSQLSCYALGAIDLLDDLYDFHTVTLSIFQPRRAHTSSWTTTREALLDWGETVLRPAAQQAIKGEGKFCAGDHCRFCKAKHECRARADQQMNLMRYEFQLPPTLTDDEVEEILGQVDQLVAWAEDIKSYALAAALGGKRWKTYKLVEGRSTRRYSDENAVAEAVKAVGKDPYERRLLGITAMTQLLGRKQFNEILGDLIVKPKGKPALVPLSDKRPALDNNDNEYEGD
ncbi:MAG: DUF2800 domain-containing protein [bacterium]